MSLLHEVFTKLGFVQIIQLLTAFPLPILLFATGLSVLWLLLRLEDWYEWLVGGESELAMHLWLLEHLLTLYKSSRFSHVNNNYNSLAGGSPGPQNQDTSTTQWDPTDSSVTWVKVVSPCWIYVCPFKLSLTSIWLNCLWTWLLSVASNQNCSKKEIIDWLILRL